MRLSLAASLALSMACASSAPTPTPSAAPTGTASADLKLNAQKSGTFDCSGGLFFVTSVLNLTTAPLRVDTLSLTFTKVSGTGCANNAAPIDPQVGLSAGPGVSTEIRRVDLAGALCTAPAGAPGCEWLGKATLTTSFGTLTDEIPFRTSGTLAVVAPPAAPTPAPASCGTDRPTLVLPPSGATVSGTVAVSARISDDSQCPITLRAYLKGEPFAGETGAFAVFVDVVDSYRWDTRTAPNGRFRITAQKACSERLCGGISDPVTLVVSNP
jgi:hypothetical protein